MRAVLVLVVVGCAVGCGGVAGPLPDDGDGSGWMDPSGRGPFPTSVCQSDDECSSGEVCARASGCTTADQVRVVHVSWTVNGQPASTTTCSPSPDLRVEFSGVNFMLGWAPVPCRQGKFTIDKLMKSYDMVRVTAGFSDGPSAMLDAVTGEATIDLAL